MREKEFDKFADEYSELLNSSIRASGEESEYFARYKVKYIADHFLKSNDIAHKALDFGCGVGGSIPHFKKYLNSTKLTCVDVSKKSLDIAEYRFPGAADYKLFDGNSLPFEDNAFNVVFAACVFHHIPSDEHEKLLSEIRRVLMPRGSLFVFEHNPFNPLTVRVVNQCVFDENAVLISSGEFRRKLASSGFHSIQCRYQVFFPAFLRSLRWLERSLDWCPVGAQYCLIAKK